MKQTIRVTVVNAALAKALKVTPGATVNVETKNGVPTSREWRNRLKDAAIDGCVRIAQNDTKHIDEG